MRQTPTFPSPLRRKMVLEGRLVLTPSRCPFFLGCASLPSCCHLFQEVFTVALSLGEASFLTIPVIPIPDSTAAVCLFDSIPQQ